MSWVTTSEVMERVGLEAHDHRFDDGRGRRIEPRGRLVVEQVAGLEDHGPRDCHLALHSPGELPRHGVRVLEHPDEIEVAP